MSLKVAIVGSGNIGTDLLHKVIRSDELEPVCMVGIDPSSPGLARAAELGVPVVDSGVPGLLEHEPTPQLVFEATSASVHIQNSGLYVEAGIAAVDLTPAAVGDFVVPVVNMDNLIEAPNVNMITCGGQATIPIVAAVSQQTRVPYAEIVSAISSRSAGPGTRANIDEFTQTTKRGLEKVGGAERGKAIIILNPANPPIIMRATVFCMIEPDADWPAIEGSIVRMVESVAAYVPGYRLKAEPQFEPPNEDWAGHGRVTTLLEVEGAGDYLPPFAGNLDIMTAAACKVGEVRSRTLTKAGSRA